MQKYRFKLKCPKKEEYIEIQDDVSLIIDCVNRLTYDEFIYIYDMDTRERFVIEIYNEEYSLSMMNYCRDFKKKDELIDFLSRGLIVFKEIRDNPEKQGLIWIDDGGL